VVRGAGGHARSDDDCCREKQTDSPTHSNDLLCGWAADLVATNGPPLPQSQTYLIVRIGRAATDSTSYVALNRDRMAGAMSAERMRELVAPFRRIGTEIMALGAITVDAPNAVLAQLGQSRVSAADWGTSMT
jgi:hypothetical protein